jgi:hypothetical protein
MGIALGFLCLDAFEHLRFQARGLILPPLAREVH